MCFWNEGTFPQCSFYHLEWEVRPFALNPFLLPEVSRKSISKKPRDQFAELPLLSFREIPQLPFQLLFFIQEAVHGILQARILEWVAVPFSRGSSQPKDRTQVSHIAGRFSISWAIREAQIRVPEQGPEPWAYVQFATAGLNSGFPGDSEVKASACNAGDLGSILGLGRSPGEGNGNPLQ